MNSRRFETLSHKGRRTLLFLLAMILVPIAHGQLSLGMQTGKFVSYLGDVTLPGYGGYLGFKAQPGENFALNYQASFLHVPGKYESFPLDKGMVTTYASGLYLILWG